MEEQRRHPDIFTDQEAATYLHLESPNTLTWLREHFGLMPHLIGKVNLFHRADLDACALRMFGKDHARLHREAGLKAVAGATTKLKLAGER